jgi:hypothetical protein
MHLALVQPERVPAELLHVVHRVRDQHQRAALGQVALDPVHALALERLVADREHFVRDQQVGAARGHEREAQPHDHAEE